MKCGSRFAICGLMLLLFPLYLLKVHLEDLCNQYRAGAYLTEWYHSRYPSDAPQRWKTPSPGEPNDDKVIVMAKLEEESTDWVQEELPEYVFIFFFFFFILLFSPL